MGFLSRVFGSSGVSPERYGELLADVVIEVLDNELNSDGLSKAKREFERQGWQFDSNRFSSCIVYLYVSQAEYHVQANHLGDIDSIEDIYDSFLDSVLDSVPERYEDSILSIEGDMPSSIKLEMSDAPTLTISRLAAQKYFGSEVDMNEIMTFGARAKSFSGILDTFESEVDI